MSDVSGWDYFQVLILARKLAQRSIVALAAGGWVCTACQMPAESHLPECVVGGLLALLEKFSVKIATASGGERHIGWAVDEEPAAGLRITEVPAAVDAESFGEPWRVEAFQGLNGEPVSTVFAGEILLLEGIGLGVASELEEPYLRRICACVNAAAGQSTEALEKAAALRARVRGVAG